MWSFLFWGAIGWWLFSVIRKWINTPEQSIPVKNLYNLMCASLSDAGYIRFIDWTEDLSYSTETKQWIFKFTLQNNHFNESFIGGNILKRYYTQKNWLLDGDEHLKCEIKWLCRYYYFDFTHIKSKEKVRVYINNGYPFLRELSKSFEDGKKAGSNWKGFID